LINPYDADARTSYDEQIAIHIPIHGYTGNERAKRISKRELAYLTLNDKLIDLLQQVYWQIPHRMSLIERHSDAQRTDPLTAAKAWWSIKELDGGDGNNTINAKSRELQKALKYTGDYPGYIPAIVKILEEMEALDGLPQPLSAIHEQAINALLEIPDHFKQKTITEHIKAVRLQQADEWKTKKFTIEDFRTLHDKMINILNQHDVPIIDSSTKRPREEKKVFLADDTVKQSKKPGPCAICKKKKDIPEHIMMSNATEDHDDDKISNRYKRVLPTKSGGFQRNKRFQKPSARQNRSENPNTTSNTGGQPFSKYSKSKLKQIRSAALAKGRKEGRKEGLMQAANVAAGRHAKKDKKSTRLDADEIFAIFNKGTDNKSDDEYLGTSELTPNFVTPVELSESILNAHLTQPLQ